jgi:hypothetical protein
VIEELRRVDERRSFVTEQKCTDRKEACSKSMFFPASYFRTWDKNYL